MRLLLACLVALALLDPARAAGPSRVAVPKEFKNWTIAFARADGIWTARADGSRQKLVIKSGNAPCWSPDRKRLAFYRDGNIWVAGADGHGERQLTHFGRGHRAWPADISISWNGRTGGITFSRPDAIKVTNTAAGRATEVYGASIFDLFPVIAGRPALSVRFDISDGGTGFHFGDNANPAWSRSADMLAFTRNGDIWLAQRVPADGGMRPGWDISRLAAAASYDSPTYRASATTVAVTSLSWSPDERRLAYCANRLGGSGVAELHVITLQRNGTPWPSVTGDRKLLDDFAPGLPNGEGFQPEHASFSPDGTWVAFSSARGIFAISADGKRIVKLFSDATRAVW